MLCALLLPVPGLELVHGLAQLVALSLQLPALLLQVVLRLLVEVRLLHLVLNRQKCTICELLGHTWAAWMSRSSCAFSCSSLVDWRCNFASSARFFSSAGFICFSFISDFFTFVSS